MRWLPDEQEGEERKRCEMGVVALHVFVQQAPTQQWVGEMEEKQGRRGFVNPTCLKIKFYLIC